jgi:hypothetical protein
MIKIIFILLLLTTKAFGQYERAYVLDTDTIYLKTSTDSLFNKVNDAYVFKHKLRLKSANYFGFFAGLQSLLSTTVSGLPPVAVTGNYGDLSNRPTLFSGSYADLTNKPSLFSGSYVDLTNKPAFSPVATTGDYNDLTNKPSTAGATKVILQNDVTNNNAVANTMQDVTTLGFPVTAGVTYDFEFNIWYTSAAATTGSRWGLAGPATTLLRYRSEYTLTATARTFNEGLNAYNVPASSNATSVVLANGWNLAVIKGQITPSENGTVTARFASEISNSAVIAKAKSWVEYKSQ